MHITQRLLLIEMIFYRLTKYNALLTDTQEKLSAFYSFSHKNYKHSS